jgi:hypothetical protein
MQTKKRSPIAAATAAGYRGYLKKWLYPHVGDLPLASVDNKAARDLVAKLSESRLAPKTIVEIVAVLKLPYQIKSARLQFLGSDINVLYSARNGGPRCVADAAQENV